MIEIPYRRQEAVNYAKKWAYGRNPNYYNFDQLGGDCTNFISQCLYQGSKVMNYAKDTGWYYLTANNKAPGWTGVEFFYQFLTKNRGVGPYAKEILMTDPLLQVGDIAQLAFEEGKFAHTVMIVKIENQNNIHQIYTASHTYDTFEKPLGSYKTYQIRFLHIQAIRKS